MSEIYTANAEWAMRPSDQRFLDLPSLLDAVKARRLVAREIERLPLHQLGVGYADEQLKLTMPNGLQMGLTNWGFSQLCAQTKNPSTPASYLRKLPPAMAALLLEYGLSQAEANDAIKLLFNSDDSGYTARAFNGVAYGRIWDEQVVEAVMNNVDDRWSVPLKAYNGINSRQATTLYASDHDVFLFLVDETRPIDVDGQTYFRGFYTWNSEVGSAVFGIATFLYSYVCANRIIWGSRNFEELRVRHTLLAPDRFLAEARPVLLNMSEASPEPIIATIHEAKQTRVAKTPAMATVWLVKRGFTRVEASKAVALATIGGDTGSSGDPTNLWDLIQGGTAAARSIQHADTRIESERRWSSLLRLAGRKQAVRMIEDEVEDDDLTEEEVEQNQEVGVTV